MGDDDMPRKLPDDMVHDEVLRRLPPVALAVCRCVCKAWRKAIDSRSMLSDLLPLGIFINVDHDGEPAPPILFAPPSMGRKVAAYLRSFVKVDDRHSSSMSIRDCCNSLLMVFCDGQVVVNPATRRWWVYSSETSDTRRWDFRPFVWEGGPAGTLVEARSAQYILDYHRAVYYHGALYAKSKVNFIMRITLSDCKYQVIKPPEDVCASERPDLQLVKSKCGVYVAIISKPYRQLRVWLLSESSSRAEWMLKYNINLQAVTAEFPPNCEYPIDRPWIIHGRIINGSVSMNRHAVEDDEFEWDFDKNNIHKIEVKDEKYRHEYITLLGFHPNKEVAFLELYYDRIVAYHMDRSKVQDLGPFKNPYPGNYSEPTEYFVYTPCWMESCLDHN